ncbi:MAG: nucleotidyltransferase family protein [Conexivisphaerales archaeon]
MKAVILAGGAGTRLRPLTYVMPKCLLPVAGKPLIERTIKYLNEYGINEFIICVAYLKEQIINALGNGSKLGVKIEYAQADVPLGTGGQLSTAGKFIDDTFLAMNGDIVTNLNIHNLVATHRLKGGIGTIAVKKFEVKVPYGHISVGVDGSIERFEEKPTLTYSANAGIYIFEKRIFDYIPIGKSSSLEREIFPSLLSAGERLNAYFEEAKWADVGSMTDFERVNDEILSSEGNSVEGVVSR